MKTHAIYIIVILLLIAGLVITFHAWNKAKIKADQSETIIKEKTDEISYRINKEGRLIAEKNAAVADLGSVKKAYPKLIEDITKKLEIKNKNVLVAMQADFEARGAGRVKIITVVKKDSSAAPTPYTSATVDINDGYLVLSGEMEKQDMFDYFDYTYNYNDTLLTAISSKKSFFKGEEITVSSVLSNPNAKIIHTTGVIVHKVKPKRFNVSISVYYDPFRNTYGPAITAGYALARF